MKMLHAAVFAGFCLAAAAVSNANASTVLSFGDTIAQGQEKTYTVTFGPDLIVTNGVTPDIEFEAIAHETFRFIEEPDGSQFRTTDAYRVLAKCVGKLDCTSVDGALSGYLRLHVSTLGNVMKITARNDSHEFDDCSNENNYLCAGRLDLAFFGASFQFEGENPEFSYTVQQNGVPEPATWGLMILGFGMVGAAYRRTGALARA